MIRRKHALIVAVVLFFRQRIVVERTLGDLLHSAGIDVEVSISASKPGPPLRMKILDPSITVTQKNGAAARKLITEMSSIEYEDREPAPVKIRLRQSKIKI